MPDHKSRLAVFCSGTGSNFKALNRAITEKQINAEFVLCISNRSQCGATEYAQIHGIPVLHIRENQFPDHESFSTAMLSALNEHGIDYLILAGYLRKIPDLVVDTYRDRIVNIHPALLPKFGGEGMYGIRVHTAVLAAGDTESGATVHMVDEVYDRGKILMQQSVPVIAGDTPETLAERVLACEHLLYPRALEKLFGRHKTGNAS